MTLATQTLLTVFDTFQSKEGVWKSTVPRSYRQVVSALQAAQVSFAEWDPERGMYFLDLTPLGEESPTLDLLLLDFRGSRGSDHYRLEWAEGGRLVAIELQTHAPGPLPFLPEIAEWLEPGRPGMSPPLTMEAWSVYLEGLVPQTPLL